MIFLVPSKHLLGPIRINWNVMDNPVEYYIFYNLINMFDYFLLETLQVINIMTSYLPELAFFFFWSFPHVEFK